MSKARAAKAKRQRPPRTSRTIRFPESLRLRLVADAERCGRSFDAQVIAILRHHFGEDVDIVPPPETILALARGSFSGIPKRDRRLLTQRLVVGEDD